MPRKEKLNGSQSTQNGENTMSEMRLTEVVVNWLENQEWEERPEINEEENTSSISLAFDVGEDFSVKCFLDVSEQAGFFKLFAYYFDGKIPANRLDEVVKWANLVNRGTAIGSLQVITEERNLRFYTSIDVENATFEPQHIDNMLSAMLRVMKLRLPQMMAICHGGKTAEEALEIEPEEE